MRHVMFKYLIKELLLYFIVSFIFFFLIFFVNQILLMAEDILKKRVPLGDVTLLIIYALPSVVATAAPFATLVGFLMCIGKLVTDNEILILRALGISFRTIAVPVIIAGIVISVVSFFVNDYLLPMGTLEFNKLYRRIITSNPGLELESNSIRRNENSTLVTGEVKDRAVSSLLFFDTDSDGNQRFIAASDSLVLNSDDPRILMQLSMDNAVIATLNKGNPQSFDYMRTVSTLMNVFSSSFAYGYGSSLNPREMTSFDLQKELTKLEAEEASPRTINTYRLEYYKKFSIPFGSIFFALLAFPLALIFGKHNGQTVGLIIGLVISVLYWAMLIGGQTFGYRS
ncbi:MAG: LptF/LptG family permease, partial [Spirochaetaceae bacterium]|nr:LptF/LptG family permease [Spirochaetaceae bacterium]